MNRFFTFLLILFCISLCGFQSHAQIVWQESFTGLPNNATSDAGTTAWTTTQPSGGFFRKLNSDPYDLFGESFVIRDTGTEGVWTSQDIDISSYGRAIVDISMVSAGTNATDYVRVYYQVDPGSGIFGAETLMAQLVGTGLNVNETVGGSAIITGQRVRIVVRARENAPNFFFIFPTYFAMDDITITGVQTYYSIATGNWTTGTSWSIISHSGATCNCTPNATARVLVGDGDIIRVNGTGTAVILEIAAGSALQWRTNNATIQMLRGGGITNSGTVSIFAGVTNAQLEFNQAFNYYFVNDGAFAVEDIEVNAAANLSLSGTTTINVTDQFLLNSNGITINNNGAIGISGDLVYNGSNITLSNNGSINITDDLLVNASTQINNSFTNQASAVLSFNDINLTNGDFIINNNGTINQSGNFLNIDNGSVFNNLSGSTWNWSYVPGAAYDITTEGILDCASNPNTFVYNGLGAQNIMRCVYHNLGISGSGSKASVDNLDINGSLTIASGTLDVDGGNDNISLGGDWVNTGGTFSEGAGTETITFDGASDQSITNASAEVFNRLIVNKPGGRLVLNNDATIANTTGTGLTLTQGIVSTSSSAVLILNDNVTSTAGDADSFVDGPVRKVGNDAFIFPTGDGTVWARIGISAPTASSTFTAQYFDAPHPDLSNNGTMNNVSGREYWTLDRVGTGNATVRLFWESNTRSEIDDITSSDLIVARYNGTDWVTAGRSAISALPITTGSVTSATVSTFSPFSFGSLGHPANPLPITLKYFKAALANDRVNLTWETAQEQDNDYFTVEKATNLESFGEVVKVEGQGTTNVAHAYSAVDTQPLYGKSYYRLKQTDFDGKFTYSDLQVIDYEGPAFATAVAYPNPGKGTTLTVEINGLKNTPEIEVQIMNPQGQELLTKVLTVSTPGSLKEEFVFDRPLSPGLYILRAGPTKYLTLKFVVE